MSKFLERVFKTGECSRDEILKFMLANYFLKGYTFDDFEDDLVFVYVCDGKYAKALRLSFEEQLRFYI